MERTVMKRKSFVMCIMLALVSISLEAQTRYCLSYEDFKNNKWIKIEDSELSGIRSSVTTYYTGRFEINITHSNKTIDKILNTEARFIIHNGTMYANLYRLRYPKGRRLFGKHYVPAYRYDENKVCFIAPQSITIKSITKLDRTVTNVCYIIDSDDLNVKQLKAEEVRALLEKSPYGLGTYDSYEQESKESADIIIPQLKKLDLLKPY